MFILPKSLLRLSSSLDSRITEREQDKKRSKITRGVRKDSLGDLNQNKGGLEGGFFIACSLAAAIFKYILENHNGD